MCPTDWVDTLPIEFQLQGASIMSIRGTRSSATKGAFDEPDEHQTTEGQLQVV